MSYDALQNLQRDLIRKATRGSVFLAPRDADPITSITALTAGVVDLKPLPEDWDDLGYLTTDGAQFAREVSQSEISSFGANTPTRTDINADTTTLTIACQETKLLTLGLATGADLAAIRAKAGTGEVRIDKPNAPRPKSYRALALAVDENDAGEIYIARSLHSAKVTNYTEQSYSGGDEAILWGATVTAERDDELGTAETWLFGGPGWLDLLQKMGIPQDV